MSQQSYCVYFITMDTGNGYRAHKIGVASMAYSKARNSTDVAGDRLKGIQTGNPFKLVITGALPAQYLGTPLGFRDSILRPRDAAYYAEGRLHEYLREERKSGEWFSGPKTEGLILAATTTRPRRDMHSIGLVADLVNSKDREKASHSAKPIFSKHDLTALLSCRLQNS